MDLGRSYDPGGAGNREGTHRGDGSMVWVRRRRSVRPARGATVARAFPANQRVSVFGFGLRVVWRVSWREGSIYRRGRSERQARGFVTNCSASLARAGGGRRGTRLAAGVGIAQGLQRGCREGAKAVDLALSLRASALEESGSSGLGEPARDAAKVAAGPRAGAHQPCLSFASGNRGQRLLGRLGNDDLDLAR
uniref:Uncharacterized protein n=1 Tax=Oryza barthii TaxID=65489 RepID=A0A0D3G5H3_9ORYZ